MSNSKHMVITSNVKEKIKSLNVVFPSYYAKLYAQEASAFQIDLNPDELFDSEMLSEKVVQHVITLSSCTQKAIEAIEMEDTKALTAILLETKALRNEIDELRKIVYEDSLTKSYNRKWFEDHYLCNDNTTLSKDGVFVMIDLNKFKQINDTYGHIVGDKILSHIAAKLKELGENVIRFGGDEFLIVLDSSVSIESLKTNIEQMLLKLDSTSFKIGSENFKTSFSYGISSFMQGTALEISLNQADKEMYHYKQNRRNNPLIGAFE